MGRRSSKGSGDLSLQLIKKMCSSTTKVDATMSVAFVNCERHGIVSKCDRQGRARFSGAPPSVVGARLSDVFHCAVGNEAKNLTTQNLPRPSPEEFFEEVNYLLRRQFILWSLHKHQFHSPPSRPRIRPTTKAPIPTLAQPYTHAVVKCSYLSKMPNTRTKIPPSRKKCPSILAVALIVLFANLECPIFLSHICEGCNYTPML